METSDFDDFNQSHRFGPASRDTHARGRQPRSGYRARPHRPERVDRLQRCPRRLGAHPAQRITRIGVESSTRSHTPRFEDDSSYCTCAISAREPSAATTPCASTAGSATSSRTNRPECRKSRLALYQTIQEASSCRSASLALVMSHSIPKLWEHGRCCTERNRIRTAGLLRSRLRDARPSIR